MTASRKRALRTRVDFRITKLKVEQPWVVGRVTFRPSGWLRARLEKDIARLNPPLPQPAVDYAMKGLEGWDYATGDVTVPMVPGDTDWPIEAQEQVRDAIAVARLYQRACVPLVGLERQTFGLASDIGATLDWTWKTNRHGITGFGGSWVGVLADWTFTKAWISTFRARPAFAFLDDALRTPDDKRTDWQRRAVTAVRTVNFASPMLRQPMRIILHAVALEALLGDDPPPPGKPDRTGQVHRIARRAAYLTCEDPPGTRHGPSRPACFYLTAPSDRAVRAEYVSRAKRGQAAECTFYWQIREMLDARNAALHDAQDHFPENTARHGEWWLDRVILTTLDWVEQSRVQGIGDLDGVIYTLPR